jgi:D-alanine-D-alanine ligase
MTTPRWASYDGSGCYGLETLRFPIIVKPRFEDGSIGIEQDSVFIGEKDLRHRLPDFYKRFGPLIVEEFIAGRELNVSLFGYPSPRVLPIAEICFDGFMKDLHRIVSYRAKWDKNSFEYHHTPRVFPVDLPRDLEQKIHETAMRCFRCFMLRDYARVDLRLDASEKVHVLEVNANPCITPGAGFPASLEQAGIGYDEFVRKMLCFVRERRSEVYPSA